LKKLVIIFCLLYQSVNAQEYSFRHIGEEQGFMSDEVFDIKQDKNGLIWLATPYGLFSYNGLTFKNYTTQDGLSNNSIIKLYCDDKNRIWTISHKGELSRLENGKIKSFEFNLHLKELIYPGIIDQIYVDSIDNIYISRNIGGIFKINKYNKIEELKTTTDKNHYLLIAKLKNTYFLDLCNYKCKQQPYKTNPFDKISKLELPFPGIEKFAKKRIFKASSGDYYISLKNTLYQIHQGKIISHKTFKNEITDINEDKEHSLWVSFMYDGITLFKTLSIKDSPSMNLLSNYSVSRIFFDSEQNIWITSLHKSFYFINNLKFISYPLNSANLTDIISDKNNIYALTADKRFYAFNLRSKKFNLLYKDSDELNSYKKIKIFNKQLYAIGNGQLIINTQNGEKKFFTDGGTNLYFFPPNNKFLLLYDRVEVYKNGKKIDSIFTNNQNVRPRCIAYKSKNDYWIGTNEGLYRYINQKMIFYGNKHNFLRKRIVDIKIDKNRVYIAVRGLGLAILKNDKLKLIDNNNGLSNNFIHKIIIQNDSTIWTANQNGLNKVILGKKDTTITVFNSKLGLPSNNIKDILLKDNIIYLISAGKLIQFTQRQNNRILNQNRIIIDSILVNNKKINTKKIKLKDKNSLKLFFNPISYVQNSIDEMSYQIDSLPKIKLANSPLHFNYFTKGEHFIKFYSKKKNTPDFKIKIYQYPPVKQSVLLKIFLIILFILIILFVVRLTSIFIRKKSKEKEKYILQQHKALKSQINPVFFYQSVETVRKLLLKGKVADADNYLSDFTLLLRSLIKNSNFNLIPLSEELKNIEIYLSLWILKYKLNKFKITIARIDKKINIAPLLLFSLVDAFIEKLNKKEIINFYINLKNISENESYFETRLEYIVNFKEKEIINSERIIFIKERINLLNKLYGKHYSLEYTKKENREQEIIIESYKLFFSENRQKNKLLRNLKIILNTLN